MQQRRDLLGEPAPELLTGAAVRARSSLSWRVDEPAAARMWFLLGAHGGAGVSSLIRAGAAGSDARQAWPEVYLGDSWDQAPTYVVVVARTTAHGLEQARLLAVQHAQGSSPQRTVLCGLVLVADAPGPLPRKLAQLQQLVVGGYARTWQVPWLPEWRSALASDGPLPAPPVLTDIDLELSQVISLNEGVSS